MWNWRAARASHQASRGLRPRIRPLGALLLACAVLLGGCGGSELYAGLSEDEAALEASNFVGREVRLRESPIHLHRVQLRVLRKGKNTFGRNAWVATFSDRTVGRPFCIRVWAERTNQYQAEIDLCRGDADPFPDGGGDPSDSA